jgi:quercetin dioxygenase-like cupin family protein
MYKLLNTNEREKDLIVHGQGVFIFNCQQERCTFRFTGDNSDLVVEFTRDAVNVSSDEELIDPNNEKGLVTTPGAYYWFSVDSQNEMLCAGIGEPRMELETVIYTYAFPKGTAREYLESLTKVVFPDPYIMPMRLLRDPITDSVPLKVKDMNDLTMDDIAAGNYMPKSNLSVVSQKMYHCIAGEKFVLDNDDFPEFSQAIERSILTPGCWCHEMLLKKATEFNPDKPNVAETYLRITLSQNNGESPGVPYVMEIWPAGHYSPVHSHGGSEAVIRVLHGAIQVQLFPFLSNEVSPFATGLFTEGDIMWISPTLNQIHQLKNVGGETCVTVQCYMYDEEDKAHYDYFDYIDADGATQRFAPDSDMEFLEFKDLMREEWNARPQCCWRRR